MQGHKIFCAFCFAYVPFILANGTSFNVSPRPELPLTSSVFHFVDHPRTRYFMLFVLPMFLFITANGTSLNVFLRPELQALFFIL